MRRRPSFPDASCIRPGTAWTVIALGASLSHCSYDIVFTRASSGSGARGGATGQSDASSTTDGSDTVATSASAIPSLSPSTSWQWQLQGNLDLSVIADLYAVDLFDVTDSALLELRTSGRVTICTFSAGTSEAWRDDVASLPAEVLGNEVSARTSEIWLDVRAPSVRQLMVSRLDLARARGCTGVLPDSVDGYGARTGFPLGAAESLDYLSFLSSEAHQRGLAVGLSNSPERVTFAQPWFEFVIQVSCLEHGECDAYRPFLDANKPVLHVEFVDDAADGSERLVAICQDPSRVGYSTILKLTGLDAWRLACE